VCLGIVETCHRFGISLRAIRLYEALGLLSPRRMDGSRVYGAGELHALTLILRFKAIGYSLTETRRNLRLYGLSSPQVYPEPARAIVEGETVVAGLEHRRENIVAMLAEFRVIRDDLARRMSARTSASIGGHRGGTRGESGAAA
jgi:DNA-binding transcriptional MerR regulator